MDVLPDKELLQALQSGKLSTAKEVCQQAQRMLADPRAKAKLRHFLLTWLKVDGEPDIAKDPRKYPGFDTAIVSDLRSSLELSIEDVLDSDTADFRQLRATFRRHFPQQVGWPSFMEPNCPSSLAFTRLASTNIEPGFSRIRI